MRIEIDTKSDSKEELKHLANMLMALSNSSSNVIVKRHNIFDDPSPGIGMIGMFSDSPSQAAQQQASQPTQSPSLFSIFSDPPQSGSSQPSLGVLDEDDGKRTSAKDVLDDDRIVPYS
jgi:hypothetical protein